jgi:exopolysaccharide biosynthesis polyprenyl glycosylphosphotransferase
MSVHDTDVPHRLADRVASSSGVLRRLELRGAWWRDSLLRRLLAVADLITAALATAVVLVGTDDSLPGALRALLFLPVWILLAKLHGLYDRDHRAMRHLTVDELPSIVIWALAATTATVVLLSVTGGRSVTVWHGVDAWLVACTSGFVLRSLARYVWRRTTPRERTLIVGSGPLADATRRKLELFRDMHLEPVASESLLSGDVLAQGNSALGSIDRVILATPSFDEKLVAGLLAYCRRHQIKLSVIPPIRGMFGTAVQLDHVADLPVVQYNTWDVPRSTQLLKRCMDVALAALALVLLTPLFVLVAIAIRLDSSGPALFAQSRAGRNGMPFRMWKFRTMVCNAEALLPELVAFDALSQPMFKLRNDPRVTRVGRLLRRTSLDELPQLVNVFRGEMSLVGPRPEQVELVARYQPEGRFRLAVRPGLTGPMQVYGRGELTFEERLAVEREYIENLALGRDLRILALTVAPLFSGRGAF